MAEILPIRRKIPINQPLIIYTQREDQFCISLLNCSVGILITPCSLWKAFLRKHKKKPAWHRVRAGVARQWSHYAQNQFVCLFVWGFSSHLRMFHSYGSVTITVEGLQILPCSALMAIGSLGFFSVPLLLWHAAPVYNCHLRGPVTLTPIAGRLAVELSLSVFST